MDNYKINFEKYDGLFYKYSTRDDFKKFWDFFEVVSGNVTKLFIICSDVEQLKEDFFSFFSVIDAAGGVVTNNNGDILLIKRFGKWDLPKGKVDDNENFENAAMREISEECGITSLDLKKELNTTYHTYYLNNQQILKQTHWFEFEYKGNEPLAPAKEEDITEAKWLWAKFPIFWKTLTNPLKTYCWIRTKSI